MRAYLTVFVAAALAILIAAQDKQKTPDELSKTLNDVRDKRSEVQQRLERVKAQRSKVKRDIRAVDQDLTRVNGQLIQTSNKLNYSIDRRDELSGDLDVASAKMTEYRTRVETRLRQMYRQPDHSVLTVIVGAQSIGDLAERKTLLERIAKHDKELFEDMKVLRAEIAEKKGQQEGFIADISTLKEQQVAKQGELLDVQEEKKQVLDDLTKQQRKLQAEFDEYDRQDQLLQERIRAYQAGKAGTSGALHYGGRMIKPAQGPYTSGFGMRFHPILRKKRPHNGLDIGAPNGSPISAAASGVVITAGWINGFGNTVVIDHGDGVSTLYGHCSVLYVKEGQRVMMGDRIAAVGSTGLATGPHLHFEVRIKGSPVNPRRYLP